MSKITRNEPMLESEREPISYDENIIDDGMELLDYVNDHYDMDNNYIDINNLDVSKLKKNLF